jgi:hypothetical protein
MLNDPDGVTGSGPGAFGAGATAIARIFTRTNRCRYLPLSPSDSEKEHLGVNSQFLKFGRMVYRLIRGLLGTLMQG